MVMANQTRTSARAISESPVRIEFSMVMANHTRTSAALLHLHRGPIKGPSATLRLGGGVRQVTRCRIRRARSRHPAAVSMGVWTAPESARDAVRISSERCAECAHPDNARRAPTSPDTTREGWKGLNARFPADAKSAGLQGQCARCSGPRRAHFAQRSAGSRPRPRTRPPRGRGRFLPHAPLPRGRLPSRHQRDHRGPGRLAKIAPSRNHRSKLRIVRRRFVAGFDAARPADARVSRRNAR